MSILALNKVNYSYKNGKKVLNDVSIEFEKGKFYTILGVSGSGKTTLLSLLAGLDEPSSGQILYNNEDIKAKGYENHRKNNISLIFQNYNLIDYMTPLENIRIVNSKADKRILNDLGLKDDEINRNVLKLSGGQQQRVAIARALAKKPDILLLDEPLSNLDTKLRVETRQEIRRIQKETGVTAIFVTHDQEEAMSISDEIVLMKDGAIQQVSSPSDIYMNPVNKFVASFIGSPEMNFIDLECKAGVSSVDSLTIENLPKDKSKVILGVRAEDFEVADKGLKTKVVTVEILGRERLLTLDHNGSRYKMLVDKEFFIDEGAELIIKPKTGKSYVFDSESEEFITKC